MKLLDTYIDKNGCKVEIVRHHLFCPPMEFCLGGEPARDPRRRALLKAIHYNAPGDEEPRRFHQPILEQLIAISRGLA